MNCVSEVSQFSRPKCPVSFVVFTPIPSRSEFSMNVTRFSPNVNVSVSLSDSQINDLARPLMEILEAFYQDPKNEEDFQKWLLSVEEQKAKESIETSS